MKIYFTAAITDVPAPQQDNYLKIVGELKILGHQVVADHILGKTAQSLASQSEADALRIYRKLIVWKNQADLVVAETSYPSFGVGQEISYALMHEKPVIALYLPERKPHLLTAIGQEYLHIVEYAPETLKRTLSDYIDFAKGVADTRFNFFISPDLGSFLDWISKKRKLPRAVFLRQLIEEDLRKNKQYLRETKGSK
ncbi:MAG: hypothetical protein A2900_04815 [Candidatus Chisholmbacteria bacterium RIFCSPLOWO2_01_FULL_50_28]|uniref:Nucleoside 2-deoxyribosyltransferase n=1 Tax=Candidatus Chisholmbacteria bacterium RIFCSPHIGHO2_01_FULL_52_32 TaxID=1797591 RepID=A0A1G1VS74_9BACT|nr:MAG: hypothetical protein A2786_01930 [Candidatus Chisholmbacteria bacterium RIFCSPHIGHO2_01_FULL_52_32]OGY20369.1 MAG: hypothetical protein A2900_04815 [Candidatus Chisholmbacteria bacterium RIFCSPLOWO2_01_FULL_50_28]